MQQKMKKQVANIINFFGETNETNEYKETSYEKSIIN